MLDRSVRVIFAEIGVRSLSVGVFLAVRLGLAAAESEGPVGGAAITIVLAAGFGLFCERLGGSRRRLLLGIGRYIT